MTDPFQEPDWDRLIDDVNARIATLRMCWKGTERDEPSMHPMLVRDIYVPALRILAEFCAAVEIGTDEEGDAS